MFAPLTIIALMLAAAALAVAFSRRPAADAVAYGAVGVLSVLLALWALVRLASGAADISVVLPIGLPWLGAHFAVDGLSAFFLLVVNLATAAAALFGWGYVRAHAAHGHAGDAPAERPPAEGPVAPLFPAFVAGMNLVLIAADAFVFLVGWEFMSLASWLLVLSTHREPATQRAARVYLIMASFGTLALLLAFGLLAGSDGAYAFESIRNSQPGAVAMTLAVLLTIMGAGSKAGVVPLHVWLPLAHPAAPSHVSALMSGVMTKVAIYAIVRVLFDLLPEPQWWWGGLLLALGALTAVLGVLYALMQDDMKTLLAYSTVENIGAIIIALGLALVFKASHTPVIAALAMAAALLHVLNHSLFKSLMFFVAGGVLSATGVRDLGRLGGLIHVMPLTAFLALVGSAAIAALPPLNGFVGEWLLFQAILNAPALPQWVLKIGIAVVGALLALSTALAAACFVRFYGMAFLGRPRGPEAVKAHDVNRPMLLGMAIPAALSVAIGVLPTPVIRLFEPALLATVEAGAFDDRNYQPWFWLAPTSAIGNSYSGLIMVAAIAGLSALLAWVIHRYASRGVRRGIPWGCGFTGGDPMARSQYTPSSFSQPLRRVFGSVAFSARDEVDMPQPGETRAANFRVHLDDPAWRLLFTPIVKLTERWANAVNRLQFLTIRRHLSLMFFALVALLAVVALLQR
ncbi:MAG TPA: hydrogenase 4 subunit B [Azospirillaceae bacterium]|nr:hydrogenase 4 subunit B [Azospirillaceae bacterium]